MDKDLYRAQTKALVNDIQALKEKIDRNTSEAEQAQRDGDYQASAKIRYSDIPEIEKQIKILNESLTDNQFLKQEVETEDIADILAKWTGVPVTKIISGEQEKLLHLEDELKQRVIGQDEALSRVSDVIRMSKMGLTDQDRPLGSFLFFGGTGVGKTELSKSLTEVLFDDEKALLRVDMSEYMEPHSIAKLIGSPPGYVGYDEGGQLTEQIRRRPYAVILIDEMEKAHPNVLNILLQVLDDGRLTDTKGRVVNFKNTILIMTSNLKEEQFRTFLRPEFINRIDDILHFNNLGQDAVKTIADLQLTRVIQRMAEQGITIKLNEDVKSYLVKNGYNPKYGARPVKRLIRREILAGLSKYLLQHPELNQVQLNMNGDMVQFHSYKLTTQAA
mgnify:CR=1 FL=1